MRSGCSLAAGRARDGRKCSVGDLRTRPCTARATRRCSGHRTLLLARVLLPLDESSPQPFELRVVVVCTGGRGQRPSWPHDTVATPNSTCCRSHAPLHPTALIASRGPSQRRGRVACGQLRRDTGLSSQSSTINEPPGSTLTDTDSGKQSLGRGRASCHKKGTPRGEPRPTTKNLVAPFGSASASASAAGSPTTPENAPYDSPKCRLRADKIRPRHAATTQRRQRWLAADQAARSCGRLDYDAPLTSRPSSRHCRLRHRAPPRWCAARRCAPVSTPAAPPQAAPRRRGDAFSAWRCGRPAADHAPHRSGRAPSSGARASAAPTRHKRHIASPLPPHPSPAASPRAGRPPRAVPRARTRRAGALTTRTPAAGRRRRGRACPRTASRSGACRRPTRPRRPARPP